LVTWTLVVGNLVRKGLGVVFTQSAIEL
jgi:hypothetical protein